ncbi:MAG: hypothetical protein CVU00_05545 [Bacteroidetes bacterium HGW-Bacteroidetes-17]|nr:MAG: hypothetical protein CVU00_05545 [Bacteroidetes bacterium HGW-Bacteroidetes-17]
MDKHNIILIAHGQFESGFLSEIAEEVALEYNCSVAVQESQLDLMNFYEPTRRQYDGYKLLKEIDGMNIAGYTKKIGLFRVDLFIPILTYIFGQAFFKGNSGIASLYRLKNEQYGMKPDQDLLFHRFRKVIIHEIGHTFGLIHCHVPNCVMRSSTYVEDIDQKRHHLCCNCRSIIAVNEE